MDNDCSHRVVPPFGVDGGAAGAVGHNAAVFPDGTRVALKGDDEIDLPAGGVFEMLTPGGADKAVSLSDCSENGRTCLPIKPTS